MTPWQEQIVNFRRTHRRVILLYYTICLATFLAILLRHKLHAKLQGVSCLAINKSRNVFVATTIARVLNQVLLFATIAATLQRIFKALHSVTSLLQRVSLYVVCRVSRVKSRVS